MAAPARRQDGCPVDSVSVVVPLFNEEENMSILQSELRAALADIDHEIVFVDDGSIDRTVEKIERAPNVRTVRIEKNTGQSAALYVGCKAARGATVVMIDGDLQNDPADIPRLLAEISKGAGGSQSDRVPEQSPSDRHRHGCDEFF